VQILLPLLAMALSSIPAATARGCDASTLQHLDPRFGEILSRVQLPSVVQQAVEIEKQRIDALCTVEETDEACIGRLTDEHSAILAEGQRLTVTLEGPLDSVRAVFEVGGVRLSVVLPSYEDAAAFMEAERQQSPDIRLVSAGQVIDPAQRTAVVRAVEDGVETLDLGAGSRMVVRLTLSPLDALRAAGELDGITVVSWTNQVDGTAILDLRCQK